MDDTCSLENVSLTHSNSLEPLAKRSANASPEASLLDDALDFAAWLYDRVALGDVRSHRRLRIFIAALGLAVREARRDPEKFAARCAAARVKGRRVETRVVRMIAGIGRNRGTQTQIARWANAAAYVAHPCNGDEPPPDWRAAIRYVSRRGYRNLSDLYAHRANADAEKTYGGPFYYQRTAGSHDGWNTPPYILLALGMTFDCDPASPGRDRCCVPALVHYTVEQDGLSLPWWGVVFCNPPYGRGIIIKWVQKFIEHANGILLVPDSTATKWWQYLAANADLILFVNKKIPFHNQFGEKTCAFPVGSSLVAIGSTATQGLIRAHQAGLGVLLPGGRHIGPWLRSTEMSEAA